MFCKVIAAVVIEVSGIDIEDQFTEFLCIGFQATGGDCSVCHHLIEHYGVVGGGCFEIDIHALSFRHNVLVDIAFFFTLIMTLSVGNFIRCHSHISCAGTMNTVASCHILIRRRALVWPFRMPGRLSGHLPPASAGRISTVGRTGSSSA